MMLRVGAWALHYDRPGITSRRLLVDLSVLEGWFFFFSLLSSGKVNGRLTSFLCEIKWFS